MKADNKLHLRRRIDGMLFFACLSIVAAGAYPLLRTIYNDMTNVSGFGSNNAQNVFYPFVAAGLAWMARERLRLVEIRHEWLGVAATVLACASCFIAWKMGKYVTARYVFVGIIIGLVWMFFGRRYLRAVWGPILLIVITVPLHATVMERILKPATYFDRALATKSAVMIMNAAGVPTWRDGFNIHIPEGMMNVDITCTGVGFVTSLAVITVILLYLSRAPWKRRLLLLPMVPIIGVAANVARIVSNLVAAHIFGISVGYQFFHDAGGLVFAVVAMLGLIGVARRLGIDLSSDPVVVGGVSKGANTP